MRDDLGIESKEGAAGQRCSFRLTRHQAEHRALADDQDAHRPVRPERP
jgi:hypothetical protein